MFFADTDPNCPIYKIITDKWTGMICLNILHISLSQIEIKFVFLRCIDRVFCFLKQEKGAFLASVLYLAW